MISHPNTLQAKGFLTFLFEWELVYQTWKSNLPNSTSFSKDSTLPLATCLFFSNDIKEMHIEQKSVNFLTKLTDFCQS